jgi:hypothetical protein
MKASHSSFRVEKHDNDHSSYRLPGRKRRGKLWQWTYKIPDLDRLNRLQATNPRLFEIIRDGNISIIKKKSGADQLRKVIMRLFTDPHKEDVLWTAWQRFAEYDLNSSKHRDQ